MKMTKSFSKLRDLIGGAWANPVGRTAIQAGLAVVVASGVGFTDVAVWKSAVLATGAALLAKLQAVSRG